MATEAAANLLNRKQQQQQEHPHAGGDQEEGSAIGQRDGGEREGSQCKGNPITKMNLCTFQREQTNSRGVAKRGYAKGAGDSESSYTTLWRS